MPKVGRAVSRSLTADLAREAKANPSGVYKDLMKKRNKFGAVRTIRHGITFHSKGEADRYDELLLLERAGEIQGLHRQVMFPLIVNEQLICKYYADFYYTENGKLIIEDHKGWRTPEYRIKKKLLRALSGLDILETGKPSRGLTRRKRSTK